MRMTIGQSVGSVLCFLSRQAGHLQSELYRKEYRTHTLICITVPETSSDPLVLSLLDACLDHLNRS